MNSAKTPSTPTSVDPSIEDSPEERLQRLDLRLPPAPKPFGTYKEAVRASGLLFLTGMLPTDGKRALMMGRVGAELDSAAGREAARLATLNAIALIREALGSLDQVRRIVKLAVYIVTSGDFREHPKVADGASDLLQDVFGPDRNPCRLVFGVASLPLGVPVELELVVEVED